MSKKLFVGNLSFQLTDMELEDLFRQHGSVTSAKVVVDRRTGRSRGYGFVEMDSESTAQQAMEALNGSDVKGRPINVSFAREDQEGGGRRNGGFRSSYGDSNRGGGGFDRKRRDYNY